MEKKLEVSNGKNVVTAMSPFDNDTAKVDRMGDALSHVKHGWDWIKKKIHKNQDVISKKTFEGRGAEKRFVQISLDLSVSGKETSKKCFKVKEIVMNWM